MFIITFLFVYIIGSTALLSFLWQINLSLQQQLYALPKTFTEEFQVRQFFVRLSRPLKRIYPLLETLYEQYGRPPIDYYYQFRFLPWWKLFGSPFLEKALEKLNSSVILKLTLRYPPIQYTSQILKGFLKKLTQGMLNQIQLD